MCILRSWHKQSFCISNWIKFFWNDSILYMFLSRYKWFYVYLTDALGETKTLDVNPKALHRRWQRARICMWLVTTIHSNAFQCSKQVRVAMRYLIQKNGCNCRGLVKHRDIMFKHALVVDFDSKLSRDCGFWDVWRSYGMRICSPLLWCHVSAAHRNGFVKEGSNSPLGEHFRWSTSIDRFHSWIQYFQEKDAGLPVWSFVLPYGTHLPLLFLPLSLQAQHARNSWVPDKDFQEH